MKPARVALGCLLAVALVLPALGTRILAEHRSNAVNIAVVDSSVGNWTDGRSTSGTADVLDRVRGSGVGSLVVGMRSVRDYVESGDLTPVDVRRAGRGEIPAALDRPGQAVVIRGRPYDPDGTFARAVEALTTRFGARLSTATTPDMVPYLRVAGARDLDDFPVGYDQGRLRMLWQAGFHVVLALPARVTSGRTWLEAELDEAASMAGSRTVLALGPLPFAGGSAADLDEFTDFLRSRDFDLALPDMYSPAGDVAYASRLSGRLIRTHVISVTTDYDRHAVVVRAHRAEKERGVRFVVLRASGTDPRSRLPLSTVLDLAPPLTRDLPVGLHLGTPEALAAVEPAQWARALVLAGGLVLVAMTGFWWLGAMVRRRVAAALNATLVALTGAAGLAALLTDRLLPWQLVTFVVGSAGAVLSVLAAMRSAAGPVRLVELVGLAESPEPPDGVRRGGWGRAFSAYALGMWVAMTTGLVVAAFGARSLSMVGLAPFVGVKALLVGPPVLVAVYALLYARRRRASVRGAGPRARAASRGRRLTRVVRAVRPRHVFVTAVVLALVGYLLLRSGNSGAAPGFELSLRDTLDETLYIRPRFKEAFLGLPALLVALLLTARGGRFGTGWVAAVVAAVGTASTVDTFGHFHTPVAAALLRTVYASACGLVLGALVAGMLAWLTARPRSGRKPGGKRSKSRARRAGQSRRSRQSGQSRQRGQSGQAGAPGARMRQEDVHG
ncbi:DUF5693 family protein [Actinopolymorpha singaporensis]|uniref:DUF5693 family protein n=1 Tax=Actinopolymorpha singaporensis TaxID=117157 RepID=UPI0012FD3F60|nr:DUF5693 family protein [Actinopolymorpha singaporensis]